ncbi:MAG: LysM peptidoglycan-binding domain-containing protein [Candidatus Promineifilaceae bacterium]|jgi:hypothetical protein
MDGKVCKLLERGSRWFASQGVTAVLVTLFLFLLIASVQAQDAPTSTPDADGIITIEVQPDDSLWAIAARAGITIPELLELNGFNESVVLQPGDRLIVARVTPQPTATSDIPTPTIPPPSPSPTAVKPRTAVCILAYDDLNRDGKLGEGEALRPNVAFTVYNEQEVVANYVTDGLREPYCLEDLAPGVYHVTRSLTNDEVLTTEGDWALTLSMGSVLNLAFGSYNESLQALQPTLDPDQQLRTRIALTPQATPTATPEPERAAGSRTSLMVGLAIALFSLLAGLAVLTYLVVRRQQSE